MFTDLAYRLRAILRRNTVERELHDELEFHMTAQVERLVAAGVPRAEAVRQARLAVGGLDQLKEECRDSWGIALVDTLRQDIRYGVRVIARAPVFAATAVLTIALSSSSIGTVLTLGYSLFGRGLPVERSAELVEVASTRGAVRSEGLVSYSDYAAFRDGSKTVSGLAAYYPTAPLFVLFQDSGREINGAVVSANFFDVLRLSPALGRFFREDEDRVPDRDRVVVISQALWRSQFGASPAVIGTALTVNGVAFTIVGVTPAAFSGMPPVPIELYMPAMMLRVGYRWCDDALAPSCTILRMIGRLATNRTRDDAQAEFATLLPPAWSHARPGENSGIVVAPVRGMSTDDDEPRLLQILGAVAAAVLLVCCVNLAGLVGARSAARSSEFAVRLALGAGPRRVIGQVVTESLILAAAGGLGGVALSRVFVAALNAMFFGMDDEGHPLAYDFSQTTWIALSTIGVALLAGVLFSVVPAVRIVRARAAHSTERFVTSRWRLESWALGVQTAVAVAMAAIAGLLIVSAQTMQAGRNYDPSHVALMRLRPRLVKYAPERAQRVDREIVRRLRASPGVVSVSLVGVGTVLSGGAVTAARPDWSGEPMRIGYNEVGPAYFATIGTPLAAGREFDEEDSLDHPRVAIVNETLAARLWPSGQAMGSTIVVAGVPRRVVGVVTDLSLGSRMQAPAPWVYVPFWQNPLQVDARLAIRVRGDPASALPALVREANRVDPDVPIAETITLGTRVAGLMRPVRLGATFIGFTAGIAVLLTAIGLYGSLAFAVARRTREIGIRMALGAGRRAIVASIVREGMVVTATGAAIGVGLAIGGTRAVRSLLYGSAAADWTVYAAAALLVVLVGLCASLLPARQAAAVEPLIALRQD